MKKVLMMASVASMIDLFNMDNITILKNMGYEVHVACNFEYGSITSQERVDEFRKELEADSIKTFHLPVPRSISSVRDIIKSYKLMKKICQENHYHIVHCHSPIGGVIARLACKSVRKYGTKVIYTAHGFHFYKGAPFKNWMFYYPIEKWLSKHTDTIITINHEDYGRAMNKFKAKKVEYLPGVGLDIDKFRNIVVNRKFKREDLGIPEDAFIVLSVGELNRNKNHEIIIRALKKLNNSKIHYVICGKGPLESYLIKLSETLGIGENVHILGFRKDIAEICKSCDVFAFPSLREGLGMAALEAMACGLPIITSNVHGIVDYSINGITGFSYSPNDIEGFSIGIEQLMNNVELRNNMKSKNIELAKNFDLEKSITVINRIYREAFRDD